MICKMCKKDYNKIGAKGLCYVCSTKEPHREKIESILKEGFWSIEEIDTIIYKMCYEDIETINELNKFLPNKSLKDIYVLLNDLKLGGKCCKRQIIIQCKVCGTKRVINFSTFRNHIKKGDAFYCGIECMGKDRIGRNVGENNSKYNKVDYTCDFCGKSIKVPLYRYKEKRKDGSPSNHFCSKECSNKYRSVNYSGENHPMYGVKFGNERIQSMRKIGAESVQKISRTLTKPHRTINKLLDDNNISYINEKVLDFYSIDICLSDNLMIEIMGDYWHSNPLASCNKDKELKYAQKVNLPKDKAKHTYVKKYYNFELLYLWESDIEKDETLCLKLIQKYINNNGILQDYNSFNYYVNDKNELCLKDNITKPYFMI